jgi:hypothetical protein
MGPLERDGDPRPAPERPDAVVCNCNVLTEGFDCPELEVCDPRGERGPPCRRGRRCTGTLALQMVGRVLRKAGSPPKEQTEKMRATALRRAFWKQRYGGNPEKKREYFEALVRKHGVRSAKGWYRWASGESEWPPRAWSAKYEQPQERSTG